MIWSMILFVFLAPWVGGLIDGLDRKLSARMQARRGPPILQPFYDVAKLWQKENLFLHYSQNALMIYYLIMVVITGMIFFAGGDFLLVIFAFTLAIGFLVLAAYKGSSPYSETGAARELLQLLAYEPMLILAGVAFYLATGSFEVRDIVQYKTNLIVILPGIFLGLIYIFTIKLRKSPFDLSTSHHAHQEVVKGITTELSGPLLAIFEIAHWYETVLLLGMIYLFMAASPAWGVALALAAYLLEIFIDNTTARVRWQKMVQWSWIVALVLGLGNIVLLCCFKGGWPS